MITGIGYYYYETPGGREIFYVYKMNKNRSFRSRTVVSTFRIKEFKDDEDNVGFIDSSYGNTSKPLASKHIQSFIKDIFADKRIFIERDEING